MVLCWGWIDGLRKGFDRAELSAALFAARQEERLEPDQRRQCRAAHQGRQDDRARPPRMSKPPKPTGAGRAPTSSGKDMKIPADLQAAIDAEPKAKAMLAKLSAQNRFALAFRTHNMKTEAGRKRKIETFVAMLKRGETIYPQEQKMKLSFNRPLSTDR